MSILQSKESELRYLKRKNLEQESRIVGNWYRDIIRSYGCDVIYHKLNTSVFENYNKIIDQNTILQQAYGYNINPDYSCSAHMISYMEVDQDIFQLNKYGLNPNTDVNFYFDSIDFACSLATKLGQYYEYKINESEIVCEVPKCTDEIIIINDPYTGEFDCSSYVSSDVFPYALGLGYAENYFCDILSGKLSVQINGYELDKETTIVCDPYEHTDFKVDFPANDDLYKSLKYRYKNTDYLQTLVFLTFKVTKTLEGYGLNNKPIEKYILKGKIHGSVLFYDIFKIGKYLNLIHPEVGDIITLDYPDEKNAEKYEITDCYDKSLQSDGISPLLHNYVWKCKARRYINNYDEIDQNEADKRVQEKQIFEEVIQQTVMDEVSQADGDDAIYGGYDSTRVKSYDSQIVDPYKKNDMDYVVDGEGIDIMNFACGTKLVTDGYELYFVNSAHESIKMTILDNPLPYNDIKYFENDLRYLKATDSCLVFVNVEGTTYKIIEDEEATMNEMQLCLNSMLDSTLDKNQINQNGNNFYVFKESKTLLWSTEDHLYCKLASNGKLYKLI